MNKRQSRWAEAISQTIKNQDLYGRSFTAGVALYHLARENRLEEDLEDELDYTLHEWLGEDFYKMLEDRHCHTGVEYIVDLVDLALLDELARSLEGEED